MKKRFAIEVDCANCAAKMEDAIRHIDGVSDARVNFLMKKLTLEYDETRQEEIFAEAQTVCRRIDADSSIAF